MPELGVRAGVGVLACLGVESGVGVPNFDCWCVNVIKSREREREQPFLSVY